MRLSEEEKRIIRESIHSVDPDAKVMLFGSRVNDQAKGGDIDLLCLSQKIDRPLHRRLRRKISDRLGGQRVDLLVKPDARSDFVRLVLEEAQILK